LYAKQLLFRSGSKVSKHLCRQKPWSGGTVIGILSKGQSKGFGSQMFDQLMEWASTQNINRLELTVMCHNEGALALYKKFGFEVEGTKRHSLFIDGNYVDEYYMAKLL
jgi:RimJ/RimL family protein N-acetyltransferase